MRDNKYPIIGALLCASLVLTLIFGWLIWPVSYTNGAPALLHPSYRSNYILLEAVSFTKDRDLDRVRTELGADYDFWTSEEIAKLAQEQADSSTPNNKEALQDLALTLKEYSSGRPVHTGTSFLQGLFGGIVALIALITLIGVIYWKRSLILSFDLKKLCLVATLIGVILGLVITWGLFPVEYRDFAPVDLAKSYREAYLSLVAMRYDQNNNLDKARISLGADYDRWSSAQIASELKKMADTEANETIKGQLTKLSDALVNNPVTSRTMPENPFPYGWIVAGLVTLFLGLLAWYFWPRTKETTETMVQQAVDSAALEKACFGGDMPYEDWVNQVEFVGRGQFDHELSIMVPIGEEEPVDTHIGTCGITIATTMSPDPTAELDISLTTAFEIWIHDPVTGQNATKVFASPYATKQLKEELEQKGHVVLATNGAWFELETDGLLMRCMISDIDYATNDDKPDQPPESCFKHADFKLAVWRQEEEETEEE